MARNVKAAAIGAGAFIGLSSAYVALRYYIRGEVLKSLKDEYKYPVIKENLDRLASVQKYKLGLPTAEEFAESLVPIASIASPYQAIEDVLKNGRKSPFWPEKYRKMPKGSERLEPAVFRAMQAAYYTPEGATGTEMAAAAAGALIQGLAQSYTAR